MACVDDDRTHISTARFVKNCMRPFIKFSVFITISVGLIIVVVKMMMQASSVSFGGLFWGDFFATYLFFPSIIFDLPNLPRINIPALPSIVGFKIGKFTFVALPLLLDILELLTTLVGWLGSISVSLTCGCFKSFDVKFFDFEFKHSPLADVPSEALSSAEKVNLKVSIIDDAVDALDALRSVQDMKQLGQAALRLVRRFREEAPTSDNWKDLRREALDIIGQIGESDALSKLLTEYAPDATVQELSVLRDQALELKADFEYCTTALMELDLNGRAQLARNLFL